MSTRVGEHDSSRELCQPLRRSERLGTKRLIRPAKASIIEGICGGRQKKRIGCSLVRRNLSIAPFSLADLTAANPLDGVQVSEKSLAVAPEDDQHEGYVAMGVSQRIYPFGKTKKCDIPRHPHRPPYTLICYTYCDDGDLYLTTMDKNNPFSRHVTRREITQLQAWIAVTKEQWRVFDDFVDDIYVHLSESDPSAVHFRARSNQKHMFPFVPVSFVQSI